MSKSCSATIRGQQSSAGALLISVVLICGIFTSCGSSHGIQVIEKQSLYDRVTNNGVLHCGYIICPPACVKDPNSGKLSGMAIEAIDLVGKKLGIRVDYTEEVGWSTAIEGLEADRYDLVATPLWANSPRAKRVGFSLPICFNPVYAYIRKGDRHLKGHIERINSPNVKVSTMDGEAGQVIAGEDFPNSARLDLPQTSDAAQLLLNVATHKADVVFCEPLFAYIFNRNNSNSLELLDGKPVRVYPQCWVFKRGEPEFKAMFDTVLEEVMNSGALDRLITKYEPIPNLVYRVARPYEIPREMVASGLRLSSGSANK